jgi:hypothetical protein
MSKKTIDSFRQSSTDCPCAPGWEGEECASDACAEKVCQTIDGVSSCIQPLPGLDHVLGSVPNYTTQGKATLFLKKEDKAARPPTRSSYEAPAETKPLENALTASVPLARHFLFHELPSNIKY